MAGMKVLVYSTMKEVRARTGRTWNAEGQQINKFRQFTDGKCWMPPDEAAFLVESEENRAHAKMNIAPPYYYPLGVPAPQPDMDNSMGPALSDNDLVFHDPRAAQAAERIKAEQEAAIAAAKAAKKAREIEAEKAVAAAALKPGV